MEDQGETLLLDRSKKLWETEMKKTILLCVMLGVSAPVSAALIQSDFEAGTDGWTSNGQTTVSRPASGGNPGGYLRFQDGGPDGYSAVAPTKFLGDLTGFIGENIAFDYRVIQNTEPYGSFSGLVTISSASDFAQLDLIPNIPPSSNWTTYSALLIASDWGKSDADWLALLSDVTRITIGMEPGNFPDASGLDNVRIGSQMAVPEPSSLSLFALTLMVYGGIHYRRRSVAR